MHDYPHRPCDHSECTVDKLLRSHFLPVAISRLRGRLREGDFCEGGASTCAIESRA